MSVMPEGATYSFPTTDFFSGMPHSDINEEGQLSSPIIWHWPDVSDYTYGDPRIYSELMNLMGLSDKAIQCTNVLGGPDTM
ncbi:hypothetical protein PAXRUDRAFT_22562 [Paxillus rubicundulus Ve08.2h10]|uniref:Uncharacterized protein n=1 Tax=Paxillus rubicundulus Ve08.2h10 TaxID=930991 RepID=A0A0D0BJZ3_9AGAM|nr:hypothetical protein PAXRUDRAFT_22562 [Paxillus rubicundulus Ve08.2h10]